MMLYIPTSKRLGISRLPPELLSEIFVHCLPPGSAEQGTQKLLGSVCRLWRTLVLATPALWASLNITCNIDVLYPPLPVVLTHLRRSGAHPLSITLRAVKYSDIPGSPYLRDSPYLLTLLTTLTADRHRWRDVYIELVRMTEDILDLILLGDAPLLRSIQCVVQGRWQLPIPLRMLDRCPRLKSFGWDSYLSPLQLPLGDTSLTSLSLGMTLSIPECVTLLRLSPHLSSARLSFLRSSSPFTTPRLTHPTLHTLTLLGVHFVTLLDALTLPALQDLTLGTVHVSASLPTGWDITLPAFLTRSKPPLHQLYMAVTYTQNMEPAFRSILALTPYLRSLSVIDNGTHVPPYTAMFIHALHPPPPPGVPLCPRLQRLKLTRTLDCPDGPCGAMLRARWGAQAHANGVACLEWVDIEFRLGVHNRDQADMKKLCAEGMQGRLDLWL